MYVLNYKLIDPHFPNYDYGMGSKEYESYEDAVNDLNDLINWVESQNPRSSMLDGTFSNFYVDYDIVEED